MSTFPSPSWQPGQLSDVLQGEVVLPGQHGFEEAMPLGSLANTILLKTERMRGIQTDPAARTARIEAGAVWGDVVEAAARQGPAGLAGFSPNVGAVGYTLVAA